MGRPAYFHLAGGMDGVAGDYSKVRPIIEFNVLIRGRQNYIVGYYHVGAAVTPAVNGDLRALILPYYVVYYDMRICCAGLSILYGAMDGAHENPVIRLADGPVIANPVAPDYPTLNTCPDKN